MNEIVHIMDYSDTEEKKIRLYDLIKKIKKKYPVVVSSHVSLPEWIVKECDFYFFDKKNPLIYDYDLKNNKFFISDQFYIEYLPYETISAHIIAITRLFLIVNSSMKSMGYNIIHQIEYDCELKNFNQFEENSKIINDYDLVAYLEKVHENKIESPLWFHGVYQTLNLNSFDHSEFKYDEEDMKKILKESFSERKEFFQEKLWKKLFYKNKKVFIKDLQEVKETINYNLNSTGESIWDFKNSYSVFFNDGFINIFVDNTQSNTTKFIKIIYDDSFVQNIVVHEYNWFIFNTNKIPQKNIEVIIDGEVVKKFNLENDLDVWLLNSTFLKMKI